MIYNLRLVKAYHLLGEDFIKDAELLKSIKQVDNVFDNLKNSYVAQTRNDYTFDDYLYIINEPTCTHINQKLYWILPKDDFNLREVLSYYMKRYFDYTISSTIRLI